MLHSHSHICVTEEMKGCNFFGNKFRSFVHNCGNKIEVLFVVVKLVFIVFKMYLMKDEEICFKR